ncbi:MAG: sensor histidine kinase [Actinobacteria bacterium]|nr:sensor histidine kinase [Actinomycetota bacterium]
MRFEDQARSVRRAARMWLRPGDAVIAPAMAGLAGAAVLLAGIEVVLMVDGPLAAIWQVYLLPAVGLLYVGTGIFAWIRRPGNGMGALIVAGGFVWMAAGLANTGLPALIAIGLVVTTVPLAIVVHLLHAFPLGRLRGRAGRVTVAVAYFVVLVLQAPVYLFDQGEGGPTTVLQIVDNGDLGRVGHWVQDAVGLAVMVATAMILGGRLRRAEPARRRVLAPLAGYGVLAVLFVPVSGIVVSAWFPEVSLELAVAQLAVMAGIPIAFVAAGLSGGFARTEDVQELGALLSAEEDRPALGPALREVLGDPSLELLFRVAEPPRYVDRDGVEVELPEPDSERSVAEVRLGGRLVGAIVYDGTLIADRELVDDAARVTALAIDHERLAADLLASRESLRISRARLLEAGDAERRRIARDLHDGLQTRLVLLAMLAGRSGAGGEGAAELSAGLQEAITELRELVQGVVPATLTERGLYAAAEELTDRMPVPVAIEFDPKGGELPLGVETAGYFVVSEAFSNAVKHSGAEEMQLSIGRRNGSLRIEVVDDGVGGARFGSGLRGLADRVDALSGELTIESPPGGGTRILMEVPCA